MNTLAENYEVVKDLFPSIRFRAVLTDGDATVTLTRLTPEALDAAVNKAVDNFQMKLVNIALNLDEGPFLKETYNIYRAEGV